jgi:hypothetical protein
MNDSTSILDLPTDPIGGVSPNNNISLTASENLNNIQESQQFSQPASSGVSLDQTTISQIVNGLQQASLSGATKLASRDIPMTTTGHNIDANVQPNYVPVLTQNTDYIRNYEKTSDMIDDYYVKKETQSSLDDMYNEIQTPLLLAVLYFLFQLPFFRKFLFGYFPFLFTSDGNMNINGFLFTSTLFGVIFYSVNKITYHFNVF